MVHTFVFIEPCVLDSRLIYFPLHLVFRDLFFRTVEEGSCLEPFGVFVDCMHKCNYNSTFGKATPHEVPCDARAGVRQVVGRQFEHGHRFALGGASASINVVQAISSNCQACQDLRLSLPCDQLAYSPGRAFFHL